MTEFPGLIPEPEPWLTPGGGSPLATPSDDRNVVEKLLDWLLGLVDVVPDSWWPYLLAGLGLLVVFTWQRAKRQMYIAGQLAARNGKGDKKSDVLLVAAMVPAVLFWLAVLAGSFKGLIAFARDDLHWHDGTELLVPLTLDGVSIAFGFLAFRAIRAERSPDRCNSMVRGASLASALINFVHEVNLPEGTWLGGFYLALLSVLGVVMFHEFLDQFGEGTGKVRREKPHFGMRWFTMTPNTFCAWVAWQNYPPEDLPADASTDQIRYFASVKHAVANLEDVRAMKREKRRELDLQRAERGSLWWHPLLPWLRVRELHAVAAEQKGAAAAERQEMERRFGEIQAEHEKVLETQKRALLDEAERIKAEAEVERQRRVRAEQMAEQIRAGAERQMEQLQLEHERRVEQLRVEHGREVEQLQAEQLGQLQQLNTEQQQGIRAVLAEQNERAERLRAEQMEQARAAHRREVEHLRAALVEQTEQLQAEQRHQMEQLQAEHNRKVEHIEAEHRRQVEQLQVEQAKAEHRRSGASRSSTTRSGSSRSTVTPMAGRSQVSEAADNASLADMFVEHPESEYEWGTREINRITGAGFSGRGPRLLEKANKHLASCAKRLHDKCFGSDADSAVTSENPPAGDLATTGS
ncbi:DUF2637 domain-containing protein [Micromonospora sp. NPDC049366]|uniref:DUF2637 domain-containing protein n=1 Tax=Micromonospora sp. NPDC049366 TaxID=3364271 RepID=UPI0037AE1A12